jgi:hypothetical protein
MSGCSQRVVDVKAYQKTTCAGTALRCEWFRQIPVELFNTSGAILAGKIGKTSVINTTIGDSSYFANTR